jgi:hypothetical protein
METTMKLNQREETTLRFRRLLEGTFSFGDAVQRLLKEGLSEGKATLVAAAHAPKLYNEWCRSGRPDTRR